MPYAIIDYEKLDTSDLRHVYFVLDVDRADLERCYRVRGCFDVAENSFEELEVTHEWSDDLAEQPVTDPAAKLEVARFIECDDDLLEVFHKEMEREVYATDPR